MRHLLCALVLWAVSMNAEAACTVHLMSPHDRAIKEFSPRFEWVGSPDCVSYRLLLSNNDQGDWNADWFKNVKSLTDEHKRFSAANWADIVLLSGGVIYWRVVGYDGNGQSSDPWDEVREMIIDPSLIP